MLQEAKVVVRKSLRYILLSLMLFHRTFLECSNLCRAMQSRATLAHHLLCHRRLDRMKWGSAVATSQALNVTECTLKAPRPAGRLRVRPAGRGLSRVTLHNVTKCKVQGAPASKATSELPRLSRNIV